MDSNISELIRLAADVLKKYGIVPESLSVIQSSSIKTVWKVKSQGKALCLKRLKQTYDKALFSVNAQIHIKESGGNVPGIILDKNKRPIVEHNGQLFVLYEWLEGKDLNFSHPKDLSAAVRGLAKFHIASRKYVPVQNARISTKLGKWPEQYNSMKNRLLEWKEVCKNNQTLTYGATFRKNVDTILPLCDLASNLLEQSRYGELSGMPSSSHVLCHQDYGKGNALLTDQGVYVLDLDGVTFDFAARDLRKIIGKLAENKGQWDAAAIQEVLDWYTAVNPLSSPEKELVYIDLMFPHWFFGLVKNAFQNNKPLKSGEIEKMARLEQSKVSILKKLLKRGELT